MDRTNIYPPDKGDSRGLKFIPYNPSLTIKAKENRKNPTPAEKKIWYEILQNKKFADYKFTRQKPLDEYIIDFYCSKLLLAIEIDGDSHAGQIEYDKKRSEKLSEYGIKVIRYYNCDVLKNIEMVYNDLLDEVLRRKNEIENVK